MWFRLEHFGPVREAEIDLSKRLIVLVGPNNSGKTSVAWNVYGLHKTRVGQDIYARWADELLASPDCSIDLGVALTRDWGAILAGVAGDYQRRMHQCFGVERSRVEQSKVSLEARGKPRPQVRGRSSIAQIMLSEKRLAVIYSSLRNPSSLTYFFRLGDPSHDSVSLRLLLDDAANGPPPVDETKAELIVASQADIDTIKRTFMQTLVEHTTAFTPLDNCVIFPAERIAINVFAKEIALGRTALVDEIADEGLDGRSSLPINMVRSRIGSYGWPIRDSLFQAIDLTRAKQATTAFADLAEELERAVLDGSLSVSEQGEPLFLPQGTHQKLETQLTASVVKSLMSIVFYLRHRAKGGDFLIIDEPELNLHPDNQRKVIRVLAKAIRRGLRVMMSTHSDCVVRELNHLIMLSKLDEEGVKEFGYDPSGLLTPDDVGVYLFKGGLAHPVPVEETGFAVETIDRELDTLNRDAQRLYARIFG